MRRLINCSAVFVFFCMVMSYHYRQGIESILVGGFGAIFLMLFALQFKD